MSEPITFNEFIDQAAHRGIGINEDRPAFYNFVYYDGVSVSYPLDVWLIFWDAYQKILDMISELETQADARYAGTW